MIFANSNSNFNRDDMRSIFFLIFPQTIQFLNEQKKILMTLSTISVFFACIIPQIVKLRSIFYWNYFFNEFLCKHSAAVFSSSLHSQPSKQSNFIYIWIQSHGCLVCKVCIIAFDWNEIFSLTSRILSGFYFLKHEARIQQIESKINDYGAASLSAACC